MTPAITPVPPKLQRNGWLVAVAVILVAGGALLAGYLSTTIGNTGGVVAVRDNVQRGAVIQRADLVEARINHDPALSTVPSTQIDSLVGKRAAVDLQGGGLVSPQSVTDANVPAAGQSVVGVALTPAQLPTQPLRAGDQVRVVFTPRAQDDLPRAAPESVRAVVVSTRELDGGQVVVDVTVNQASAGSVTSIVATGRVALILDGTI